MNIRVLEIICIAIVLSSCVQPAVFKNDGYALIKSNYPIISHNDEEIEPAYTLDIASGSNTITIEYHTYRHDYHCTFTWNAESKTAYEVTDQYNRYPLTLYRWDRTNSLWATRMDPVDPTQCITKN